MQIALILTKMKKMMSSLKMLRLAIKTCLIWARGATSLGIKQMIRSSHSKSSNLTQNQYLIQLLFHNKKMNKNQVQLRYFHQTVTKTNYKEINCRKLFRLEPNPFLFVSLPQLFPRKKKQSSRRSRLNSNQSNMLYLPKVSTQFTEIICNIISSKDSMVLEANMELLIIHFSNNNMIDQDIILDTVKCLKCRSNRQLTLDHHNKMQPVMTKNQIQILWIQMQSETKMALLERRKVEERSGRPLLTEVMLMVD